MNMLIIKVNYNTLIKIIYKSMKNKIKNYMMEILYFYLYLLVLQ